jgi:hypothetical protein
MTFFIVLSLYMIVWAFTIIDYKYFMSGFLVYYRNGNIYGEPNHSQISTRPRRGSLGQEGIDYKGDTYEAKGINSF